MTKHMLHALQNFETNNKDPDNGTSNKHSKRRRHEYILKVPYKNECFTRKIKSTLKKIGINCMVVAEAGRSVKSFIKDQKTAVTCNCEICEAELTCATRHYVYQARCTTCGDSYIGASRRPLAGRISEHESSYRLNNNRTALGQHATEHRRQNDTNYIPVSGRRNFDQFFRNYEFEIIDKCKDTLETFIREGLLIEEIKPKLNNMCTNGFLE